MPLEIQAPFTRMPWQRERLPKGDFGESRTHQSFAESADINNIMKRYEKNGVIDHFNQYQGEYGDFTAVTDFHSAMNVVTNAQQMFMSLPAKIRSKFGNDPGNFLEFATDDANVDEMREMGLLPPADHLDAEAEPGPRVDHEGHPRPAAAAPAAANASPSGVEPTGGSAGGQPAE